MNLIAQYVLIAAAIFIAGFSGYRIGYHEAWDAGRQDLVAVQKVKAEERLAKQVTRQQQDDARAAAADTKGAAKTVTITQEVVKYIRTPGRNVCVFDDKHVELKRRAVDNANSIEGYDNE